MKTYFYLLLSFFLFAGVFSAKAVNPEPLIITENDGIANIGNLGGGMSMDYVKDSISNKMVALFVRTPEAQDWDGIYYYESGFNNGEGVSIGADSLKQYRYLVVCAKQDAAKPFKVTLFKTETDENIKTGVISSINKSVANQWIDYVFDLSKGQNVPNKFFMLMLAPETYNNKNPKVWIGKVYFTNRLPVSANK